MLTPWYVTGFCDGEAAFTYSRAGGSFNIYFLIKQSQDNRQIVEDIQEFFGYVGTIYHEVPNPSFDKRGLTKPSAHYRVNRIGELKTITDHFDKYPLQSKKKNAAYLVWRQMVLYKLDHYRHIDYETLREMAVRLSSLNIQSRLFKVHKR